MASRISSRERAGKVNRTADGRVSTSVASEAWSLAWTMLPGSTRRTPIRPSLGAVMVVYSSWVSRGLDRGLVGRDRGLELIDLALLLVDDLLRGDVREHQGLRACEVFLGRGELGLVLGLLGLGLVERGLEQPRIDLRQHVALLDVLAFGEQHLLQLAVDLGMNGHGERRLHGPQPGQIDRHVLPADHGDAHRHAGARGRARGVRRPRPLHAIPIERAAGRQDCKESNNEKETAAAA